MPSTGNRRQKYAGHRNVHWLNLALSHEQNPESYLAPQDQLNSSEPAVHSRLTQLRGFAV